MLSTKNKFRMMSVFVILAMLFSFANVSPVAAQDPIPPLPLPGAPDATPQDPPGSTQGTGTHFALPNSPYLPVTLDSSVPVTLTLSSVPEVVDLTIVPDAAAASTEFTLGGFAANTLYYHYTDEGLNPVTFTTDSTGSFTFTQDLSAGHHVWFRSQPSTWYLYDNATGGDCNASLGTWSSATKTCTLTGNVYDAIFIQNDGITLDGAGYQLSAPGNYAVYSDGFSDVNIKNLDIIDSAYGIWAGNGNNITVTNNTISDSGGGLYYGIYTYGTSNLSITNNIIADFQSLGIYSDGSCYYSLCGNMTIDQNSISSSGGSYGIYSYQYLDSGSDVDAITNNTISSGYNGIIIYYSNNATISDNTIPSGSSGIEMYYGNNTTVSDNIISSSGYGIIIYYSNNATISDNTISSVAAYTGIYMGIGNQNNMVRGNTVSNSSYGFYMESGYLVSYDYWLYGTNYVGSYDYSNVNNTVYQNSFVDTSIPIYLANDFYSPPVTYSWDLRPGTDYFGSQTLDSSGNIGNVFNLAVPEGGNYYSQYDESIEGCNNTNSDTFCDSAFVGDGLAVDNLPWTTQDGWVTPTDTTAPTASPTQSPAANGAGWNNSDVTVNWNWIDEVGGSGIDNANCTTSTISSGEGNPITLNATCKDLAGNEGNVSYYVKVDKTLPAVSLVGGPADGGSYYFSSVPAAPSCSASDALSGLDGSCTVSGYSALVGPHTVIATANDVAGNQNNASASYTVLSWTTNGFFQPVDMGAVWNTVRGGSTVPLKFKVFVGPTELTSTSIVNQPLTATQTLCSGGVTDEIELTATGATSLRYDGQFIYNWKTPNKPGYCYVVTVKLADGSTISANFKLR